jgi:hypothetical protein
MDWSRVLKILENYNIGNGGTNLEYQSKTSRQPNSIDVKFIFLVRAGLSIVSLYRKYVTSSIPAEKTTSRLLEYMEIKENLNTVLINK